MRFVLLTTNLSGGGAEKALVKIGSGLATRGHDIDFVVCENAGVYQAPPDCRFHALSVQAGHGWLGKRHLAWRLRRYLASRPYDLLISTLPFADEVAILSGASRHVCRIANTLSAEIMRLPPTKATRRSNRYQTLYGQRPVVAVSKGVADDLRTHFGVASRMIANPFDRAEIRRRASELCPSCPTEPYILHVGRFAPQKRHDLLFAAFSALDLPHKLVLLTPASSLLNALIDQHGLKHRVIVAGFQANPYPWMAGSDLLVLCSDHEGLPNVLIEALACGTRVISTDCPSGPREILQGDLSRWLVPCGNAAVLSSAIDDVLKVPRPAPADIDAALSPYSQEQAMGAWESLAKEIA